MTPLNQPNSYWLFRIEQLREIVKDETLVELVLVQEMADSIRNFILLETPLKLRKTRARTLFNTLRAILTEINASVPKVSNSPNSPISNIENSKPPILKIPKVPLRYRKYSSLESTD